jgi:hypothetical protein
VPTALATLRWNFRRSCLTAPATVRTVMRGRGPGLPALSAAIASGNRRIDDQVVDVGFERGMPRSRRRQCRTLSLSLSLSLSRPRELAGQRGHARFARNSVAAPLSCSRLSRTLTRFRRPRERVMTVVALGSISVVSRLWRPIPFMEWRARAYARLCRSTRSPVLSTTLNGVFASWRSASTIPISPGRASTFSTSALVFR